VEERGSGSIGGPRGWKVSGAWRGQGRPRRPEGTPGRSYKGGPALLTKGRPRAAGSGKSGEGVFLQNQKYGGKKETRMQVTKVVVRDERSEMF
jgi:hypothetical protein